MKKKIIILHLIAPTVMGGAERVLLHIADMIDRSRFKLIIGSFINVRRRNNKFIEQLENRKIPHTVFWMKKTLDIDNIFRIIKFIKKNRVDIMHTHGYRSDIIGFLAAKAASIPIVSTIHGFVPASRKLRIYQKCDLFFLKFFNELIPVSNQLRMTLIKSGIDSGKITLLHNAVDVKIRHEKIGKPELLNPELLKPELLKQDALNIVKERGNFMIGVIGRLSVEKDIPNFLNAASILVKKFNHLKFIVVGEGPEKKNLINLASELRLKDKVQFTGFVNNIEMIYPLLDLLVISSRTEGVPLVMLEAMKHCVPVVASDVGGIGEVIENKKDGLLVPPADSEELAKNIEHFVTDSAFYEIVCSRARKKIETTFNSNIWINKIEKIYFDHVMGSCQADG